MGGLLGTLTVVAACIGVAVRGDARLDAEKRQTIPPRASVSITARGFEPVEVRVQRGGVVSWTNDDDREHRVQALDGSFESPRLLPGESFSRTFASPGTVEIGCPAHPRERSRVVVVAAGRETP